MADVRGQPKAKLNFCPKIVLFSSQSKCISCHLVIMVTTAMCW